MSQSSEAPSLCPWSDIKQILLSECPDDFNYLLIFLSQLEFDDVKGDMNLSRNFEPYRPKRLRIGTYPSEKVTVRDRTDTPSIVYLYIVKDHQVLCTHGSQNRKLTLSSIKEAQLDRLFSDVHDNLGSTTAKVKLRALTCFFFLAAGHLKTLQGFSEFPQEIQKASQWI